MNTKIIINYNNIIHDTCLQYLTNSKLDPNYEKLQNKFSVSLILYCLNHLTRIPKNTERIVIISKKFHQNKLYTENKNEIDKLINKLKNGEDVKKYLSSRTYKKYSQFRDGNDKDFLLNHFNIYHFHIPNKKDILIFCLLIDNKAIFLDVKQHLKGMEWQSKNVIIDFLNILEETDEAAYSKFIFIQNAELKDETITIKKSDFWDNGNFNLIQHKNNIIKGNITNTANYNNINLLFAEEYLTRLNKICEILKKENNTIYNRVSILLNNTNPNLITLTLDFSLLNFNINYFVFNIQTNSNNSKQLKLLICDFNEFILNNKYEIISK